MLPEFFAWMLAALGAGLALFPNYFMRLRNGEPLISDEQQPEMNGLGRVIGITLLLIAAYFLLDRYLS